MGCWGFPTILGVAPICQGAVRLQRCSQNARGDDSTRWISWLRSSRGDCSEASKVQWKGAVWPIALIRWLVWVGWVGWVGLGWLGWVGLGWVGLGWVGLGWLGWVGLGWLGWIGLGWGGVGWGGVGGWLVCCCCCCCCRFFWGGRGGCHELLMGWTHKLPSRWLESVLKTAWVW